MADTEYTIAVSAEGIGTDATADEILALDKRMAAAEKVTTRFDAALEAAAGHLAKATAASDAAASALGEAEAKFARLERAATAAAKKVEKAAAAGKDTTKLQAAASAAATAVQKQAQAVDRAAQEAEAAAAQQNKLAQAYQRVSKAADRAAEETRGTERSFGDLFGAAGALGGPLGGLAGQISGIGDGLRSGGGKAGLITLAFAAGNAIIYMQKAAIALTAGAIGATAALLSFAVAADEVTSKKLAEAWDRAKKNAKGLFEGVKTSKLVKPVESLLQLLDKNTSAGKGLAKIFETLLNPVIDGIEKGTPLIKEFFKGMIIGALDAIIFVLRLRNAIAKAIPKETREKLKDLIGKIFSLANAAKAGEGTFQLLAYAVGGLALAFALLGATMLIPLGIIALFTVGPILAVVFAVKKLTAAFKGAGEEAKSGGQEAGTSFVDGVIAGIKAGLGKVAKSAAELIRSAISGAKTEAKAASPSKVMVAFGEDDFAGGMAIGLLRGRGAVEAAGEEVSGAAITGTRAPVAPQQLRQPMVAPTSPGNTRGKPGQAQVTMHLAPGAIVVQAPDGDGESIADAIRRVLLAEVDGAALQLGGGELVAGTT